MCLRTLQLLILTGEVVQMNRKGFTLIELLIVVVIIGILAAIAIPKFANTKEKAYLASMKSDLRNLITAEEAYFADSVKYTSNLGTAFNTTSGTQLEHNRRMVVEGTLAPIDIVAAQTQVANLEQAEFAALDDVNRAENNLKNLIAEDQKASIWNASLIPTDDVDLTVPPVVLSDAMKAALDNRPELRESDLAREINQLDQKLYRDLTKPQVDLVGTYGVTGNADTLVTTTNPLTASNELVRQRVNELSGILGVTPPNPQRRRPT